MIGSGALNNAYMGGLALTTKPINPTNVKPTPLPYGVTQYGPNGVAYQGAPTKDELVSGQLIGLLSSQNPYIQQARAQGTAAAAGRGLLNSSMAAGSAQNAATAAALPIAQGNAQEFANTAAANQMASNQQLGAQTAASAQVQSALAGAGATIGAASIRADVDREAQKLQYQLAGQQLGFNYAQLGQQGSQFNAQLGQQGAQFNAQLAQSNQQFGAQLNQQQTQFQQNLAANIGQYQANQMWQQYTLGTQLQQNSQNAYASMFSNIMMNPNMTAAERSSALTSAQQFYGGMAQQNAALPAFVPPWINDPNYWSNAWIHP